MKTMRLVRTQKSQREVAEGITAVLSKHEALKEMEIPLEQTSFKQNLRTLMRLITAAEKCHALSDFVDALEHLNRLARKRSTHKGEEEVASSSCLVAGRRTCFERSWRYSGRDSPKDMSRVRSVCSCHRQATLAKRCSVDKQMVGYDLFTLN